MTQEATVEVVLTDGSTGAAADAVLPVLNDFEKQMNIDLQETFFSASDFCVPCEYTHKRVNATFIYNVIFDKAENIEDIGDAWKMAAATPQVMLRSTALKYKPLRDDTLKIKGLIYTVKSITDDGLEVTTIALVQK